MKRLSLAVLVLVVLAVGGYFGASQWAQARAEKEVEAAFSEMRASGMTASHGGVTFDLLKRTLVVVDISLETKTVPLMKTRIGRVTATGVSPPVDGRVSLDHLALVDVAVDADIAGLLPDTRLSYRVPRAEIVNYYGPVGFQRRFNASSFVDVLRVWLEYMTATSANSITVPSLNVTAHIGAVDATKKPQDLTLTYSDITLRDMRKGHIGGNSVERAVFSMSGPAELGKFDGEINRVSSADIDLGVILTLIDPESAKFDGYRRIYGRTSIGSYKARFGNGRQFQVDSMVIDGVKVRPSKLNLNELSAIIDEVKRSGPSSRPEVAAQLLDRIAGLYESMAIDSFDMDGFAMEIQSEGSVKLASLKLRDFANGRIAEYAIEGLDIREPGKDPAQIGRAAVLGLKVADLLRWAKNAAKGAMTPEHSVGMLKLLEGVSINKVTVPMKPGQKPVVIDVFDLSWGQYVGLLPSKARMTLKLSGPIDAGSGNEFARYLVQSGITSITVNLDVGAGWTEASHTFVVTPLSLDVTDWLSANASVSLGDVTREIFTLDPTILNTQAMGLEVGTIEITVRDSGAIDRFLAQLAKDRNLSPEDGRRALLIDMNQAAEPVLSAHPELRSVFNTAVKFLESSKGTLSVKVTPKGKVQIMNLIVAGQGDPFAMLSSFKIDATASR